METRTRKAFGCFVLLAYIAIYAMLAASLGVALVPLVPTWAQLIFYAIAGIIWIFPLKPLFAWMNRGTK
jgi:membrane protein implicated in regulation of membrane protease activity